MLPSNIATHHGTDRLLQEICKATGGEDSGRTFLRRSDTGAAQKFHPYV
jgi:hypothetical protein